ncbi:MAG: pyridoxal-phosphate dependent enzyme [Halobellus sp.]|uniref:pyridoxal-phosphate dependent enzyme n=1 Tax=Halobellus sp. TaxID=1979212 RepID=UPI0035D465C2
MTADHQSLPPSLALACSVCDRTYDRWAWRCDCGAPLDFETAPTERSDEPLPADPPSSWGNARDGLWTFERLLPVDGRVSLGEGRTPLVEADDWDAEFKLEYVFPTGSFKDRGATVTLSVADALGVDRVVEDSSGNAGAAIATYAARSGIDAEIYIPATVKPAKQDAIERVGATPVPVEGSREAVTDACIEAVEAEPEDGAADTWYASHAWNPAFFAGTATVAYEVCAQREWIAPDAVVTPLGHGTLFLGAYRGFRALVEAGWIDEVPQMLGAQAAGYAPIADALHGGSDARNEVADGIQIRDPVREKQILDAIDDTGGDAIAMSAAAVERELDALRSRGFDTEPTCAVAPAALGRYRERGVIAPDDDVVVPLTGSGLKLQ